MLPEYAEGDERVVIVWAAAMDPTTSTAAISERLRAAAPGWSDLTGFLGPVSAETGSEVVTEVAVAQRDHQLVPG